MTAVAWAFLAATIAAAAVNWMAVATGNRRLEYGAKPATMVLLIGVAVTIENQALENNSVRTWFVIALLCSLAGDVFLMLPRDLFVPGLASFLLGHLAYVVGLATLHESWIWFSVGVAGVVATLGVIAPRILAAVRRTGPDLLAPVVGYMAVISAMVVTAWGTTRSFAVAGASLFYASDATLAWNRFVHEQRWGRIAVMVTYHLGQIGLVLSLTQ